MSAGPLIATETTARRRVRVGDRERADTADRLSAHAAAGRLSIDELEQRLERVHAAVFADDLAAVEADLPGRLEAPRRPRLPAIAIAALVVAIAATVAVGHPIPPLLLAVALLWRAAHRPPRVQRSLS